MKFITHSFIILFCICSAGCSTLSNREDFQILDAFLAKMKSAEKIQVWNPNDREFYPITNAVVKTELMDWVKSKPLRFSKDASANLKNGGACACLPVGIQISTNETMVIYSHEIIINQEAVYLNAGKSDFEINEILIISDLINPPVNIELTFNEATLLTKLLLDIYHTPKSDNATDIVIEEIFYHTLENYPQNIDPNDPQYEATLKRIQSCVLQGY